MAIRYSVAEAKDRLSQLIHTAEADGAVEITRRGKPVAMLVSVREYTRLKGRSVGFWQALKVWSGAAGRQVWLDDDELRGLRDRSPGRAVRL